MTEASDPALGTRSPRSILDRRRAGILLHPTSLPGDGDNGTLGEPALRFLDFLAEAGMRVWQMLPLGPTHADRSPYQCLSVHAGNPRLISFARLADREGLPARAPAEPADGATRRARLAQALRECRALDDDEELAAFAQAQAVWLEDYALYSALREHHGHRPWWEWPPPLRDREPAALAAARTELAAEIELVGFEQFVFFRQWQELRAAARERGILLFGDLPIFVAHDSADVWARRSCFDLDDDGRPRYVAGVPPDYFSETGQRWGNPLYDWSRMAADGYRFWVERLRTQLELFDLIRIDHFRGFEAYWAIPAADETAVRGEWRPGPGAALFEALERALGALPVVAEDLGYITPGVHVLRDRFRLPGMRVLQFGFEGGADNPHRPHNHVPDSVVYTGTHDNDTTRGWFEALPEASRARVLDYLGKPQEQMPWPLIRAALASVARLAVVPLQDALALGTETRMNRPGTNEGNWRWRFAWGDIPEGLAAQLRQLVHMYGRE